MSNNKIVTGDGLLHFKEKLADVAISNDYNDLDNKLVAGENITIDSNNVISATGTPSWTLLQTVTGKTPITLPEDYSEIYFEVQDTSSSDNISVYWYNTLYKDMIGNIQKTYVNCCQYSQLGENIVWTYCNVKTTSNSINLENMITPYGDMSSDATFAVWYR